MLYKPYKNYLGIFFPVTFLSKRSGFKTCSITYSTIKTVSYEICRTESADFIIENTISLPSIGKEKK